MKYLCCFLCNIFLTIYLCANIKQTAAQEPTWSLAQSLSVARTRHTATLLMNGKVLVVGGLNITTPCCQAAHSAELYDPLSGQWSAVSSPQSPWYGHASIQLNDGKVLVVGGEISSKAEIFTPSTRTWSIAANPVAWHLFPKATLLDDGKVLLTGIGVTSMGAAVAAEIYDPALNVWRTTGSMNASRLSHSLTLLPNGEVLAVGGGATVKDFRSAEIFNPASDSWRTTGNLVTPRSNHQAILLIDGKVLVSGGVDASGNPMRTCELFDQIKGEWQATGNMNYTRARHTLTLLPNGKVMAVGGLATTSFPFDTHNSAEVYDVATGSWTRATAMDIPRADHTATLLPNGKVLIAGGANLVGDVFSSAEVFDSGVSVVINVSAADFSTRPFAPESITTAFGINLAATTQNATGLPLPIQLGNVTVQIKDSAGTERLAPLFFISPNQINYQVPFGTKSGLASVVVNNGSRNIIDVSKVSPGLFSVDASGRGLGIAVALRLKSNGEQVYEPVVRFDQTQNRFVALPIDLSHAAEQVFLLLFGTGFRGRSTLANVAATIGGTNVEVLFAGAQGDLAGLDQANLRLPASLAGRGEVSITLTADGKTSNAVNVQIR